MPPSSFQTTLPSLKDAPLVRPPSANVFMRGSPYVGGGGGGKVGVRDFPPRVPSRELLPLGVGAVLDLAAAPLVKVNLTAGLNAGEARRVRLDPVFVTASRASPTLDGGLNFAAARGRRSEGREGREGGGWGGLFFAGGTLEGGGDIFGAPLAQDEFAREVAAKK